MPKRGHKAYCLATSQASKGNGTEKHQAPSSTDTATKGKKMTYYETSRPDWGMDEMYRREELRDAEISIEESREEDNRKNFKLFHAQIMQHVIKEAYDFRRFAIECDDLEYSQNGDEWRTYLLDDAEFLELSSNKYENEEIKDALIWAAQSNHPDLRVNKIDELANQWKEAA